MKEAYITTAYIWIAGISLILIYGLIRLLLFDLQQFLSKTQIYHPFSPILYQVHLFHLLFHLLCFEHPIFSSNFNRNQLDHLMFLLIYIRNRKAAVHLHPEDRNLQ